MATAADGVVQKVVPQAVDRAPGAGPKSPVDTLPKTTERAPSRLNLAVGDDFDHSTIYQAIACTYDTVANSGLWRVTV